MQIQKMPPYNPSIGVRFKPTKKIMYAPNCYLEKDLGKFKNYDVIISKNYTDNELTSRLIYIKDETGKWLKSKLKYFEDGVWKTLKGECNV